jgi:hypothetical protein
MSGKPRKSTNRNIERQQNRTLNAKKAKKAKKQQDKRAAVTAARIRRTTFHPSPSPQKKRKGKRHFQERQASIEAADALRRASPSVGTIQESPPGVFP